MNPSVPGSWWGFWPGRSPLLALGSGSWRSPSSPVADFSSSRWQTWPSRRKIYTVCIWGQQLHTRKKVWVTTTSSIGWSFGGYLVVTNKSFRSTRPSSIARLMPSPTPLSVLYCWAVSRSCTDMSTSQRIGCKILRCNWHHMIAQPIRRLFDIAVVAESMSVLLFL